MRTDVHNHAMPANVLDLLRSDPVYEVKIDGDRWLGIHGPFTIAPTFVDADAKLAELTARGLDAAVVSVTPPLFYTGLALEPLLAVCEQANIGLAEFQKRHPDNFRWFAHVPLGHPESAAEVLAHAVAAGAVGVEIPSCVQGRRLDEPEFEPFWDALGELGVPALMHPFDNAPHQGLNDWHMQNVIGNQLETTVAAERLICAGTLDRHPGVRIILAHAGGYLPYQLGRLRHARMAVGALADTPTDHWGYFGQLLIDTIAHDVAALRYAVDRVGVENVVIGTDLPFDMATGEPWRELVEAVGEDAARIIAEQNPERVLAGQRISR
ncbi:MAG TPA: amidohydrolase family protein [Solirubrobacteraceae bacterium]|jgi:aminocarboxymuconate-semialdehyde decarboxylase|nr:amidohydrolase family protein [Solirubrobacteraceae bacterium]